MTGDQVPDWFTSALAQPVGSAVVEVDGCEIHYRTWGPRGSPGMVLVHGGAANSRWWDHIAPLLSHRHRIAALDLSGHGDSGPRSEYSMPVWANEVTRVAAVAGISGAPLLVGHSMGGWVVLTAGADSTNQLSGVVMIDSPVRERTPEEAAAVSQIAFGPLRVYATAEKAMKHFRTVPEQPNSLPYVIDHIARNSIRPVAGGWSWKFDTAIFGRPRPTPQMLTEVTCRVALLRAEFGLVTESIGQHMYDLLGRSAPVVELPLAGHHVMLDRPLSLVTALRTVLADWEHSVPQGLPASAPAAPAENAAGVDSQQPGLPAGGNQVQRIAPGPPIM